MGATIGSPESLNRRMKDQPTKDSPANLVRERLDNLQQLLRCLVSSHRAVLRLDLSSIEQQNQEQLSLGKRLAQDRWRVRSAPTGGKASAEFQLPCATLAELLRMEREVLQASRLQGALLKRAQRKLRVVENMLAGPGMNYRAATPGRV